MPNMHENKRREVNYLWEAQLQNGIKETQFIIKNTCMWKERGIWKGKNLRKGEIGVRNSGNYCELQMVCS